MLSWILRYLVALFRRGFTNAKGRVPPSSGVPVRNARCRNVNVKSLEDTGERITVLKEHCKNSLWNLGYESLHVDLHVEWICGESRKVCTFPGEAMAPPVLAKICRKLFFFFSFQDLRDICCEWSSTERATCLSSLWLP